MLNNTGHVNITEQRKIAIDGSYIGRVVKIIAQPVFDFFTKNEEVIDTNNTNFEEEIQKIEYNSAMFQKILNDADPKSRARFNITI